MNRLKGSLCYLCGPMEYAQDNGVNWRVEAATFLQSIGVGVLNPVDKPTDLAMEDSETRKTMVSLRETWASPEREKWERDTAASKLTTIMKEIISIDLRLQDKSDFMLMYVNSEIHTCGTYVEFAHACMQRKPIVVFTNGDLRAIPLWLIGQSPYLTMFPKLDEALTYIGLVNSDPKVDRFGRWKFFDIGKIFNYEEGS